MKKSELRQIIKEEIQSIVLKNHLNEGKFINFLDKIKTAAIKAAKMNYQEAINVVDVDALSSKPLPPGLLDKAKAELDMKSQTLNEGFMDTVRKFATGGLKVGGFGSLVTGLSTLSAASDYVDMSFNKWYYETIQGMAKADVMKVMVDLYGAKATESSMYMNLGMYAFFVFFVIAVLSFITIKITNNK